MRYRTTILLLLACVFALVPATEFNRQDTLCSESYGSEGFLTSTFGGSAACAQPSRTPLESALLIFAVLCAAAAVASAAKVWREKQQDSAILRHAESTSGRRLYR